MDGFKTLPTLTPQDGILGSRKTLAMWTHVKNYIPKRKNIRYGKLVIPDI
jgi:hypothetical protein